MVFVTGGAFTESARGFRDEVANERVESHLIDKTCAHSCSDSFARKCTRRAVASCPAGHPWHHQVGEDEARRVASSSQYAKCVGPVRRQLGPVAFILEEFQHGFSDGAVIVHDQDAVLHAGRRCGNSGRSGLRLAEELSASNPRLRVVFMSGYPGAAITLGGTVELGGAFLEKPFTPSSLADKVRDAIEA